MIVNLVKVQLCAAQIFTGFPVLASRNSLYLETGLHPLISRRATAKLVTMYKVHDNEVPQYLKETIPCKVHAICVMEITIQFRNANLNYI
jgi:hypothetical protein